MLVSIIKNLLTLGLLFATFVSQAATVTEVKSLHFGKIVVVNNNQPSQLVIQVNGTVSAAPGIIIIDPGHPGRFQLDDFPPSTSITVSLDELSDPTSQFSESGIPTEQFKIEPYFAFSNYVTDSNGQLDIPLGGTLTTSGNGQSYKDGVYYRYFHVHINY